MTKNRALVLIGAALAVSWSACNKESRETREHAAQPVAPVAPQTAAPPSTAATSTAEADAGQRALPECAASLDPSPATEVKIGGRTATSTGYRLEFKDPSPHGEITFGVLGPINEDSGENMLALRSYVKFFADEKADAIIVTGDVGEVADGIARVLGELAQSKLPVMVVIGNRDCQPEFANGVAKAQKQFPNIINLDRVRAVAFPEATVVSLPGYYDPNFIQCTSGCRYYKSTVDETIALAKQAQSPVVLISHGPPKGESSQAIDYAKLGGNVGDPEINRAISEGGISFGAFSNIKEAGARATDATGKLLVQQGTAAPELFLNPGPANTQHMEMNDKSKAYGFAAVLSIKGKQGRWKLYRGKPLTADQKKQARTLAPPSRTEEEAGDESAAPPGHVKAPSTQGTQNAP